MQPVCNLFETFSEPLWCPLLSSVPFQPHFTILTVAHQSGSTLYGFDFTQRFKFNRGITAVKTRSRSEPTKKEYPLIQHLKTEYRQGYQNKPSSISK